MADIKVTSHKVASLFSEEYLIPKYQRKYSWNKENCDELWEDLLDFYDSWDPKGSNKYFIGAITVWRKSDNQPWEVIDGQQRLITLSLLIKAFLNIDKEDKNLMRCLHVNDSKGNVYPSNDLKIESQSIEENNEDLIKIIRSSSPDEYNSNRQMGRNYDVIKKNILDWEGPPENRKTITQVRRMIQMIMWSVSILRIENDNMNDALHIFETINNRGEPLADPDILKVKIYQHLPNKDSREEFNNRWNKLKDHKDIFTIYMHMFRARNGNFATTTEAPRSFFENHNKKYKLFEKWETVMEELEKINDITEGKWDMSPRIMGWWNIINMAYPMRENRTPFWKLPLYIYLCKNINKRAKNNMLIVEEKVQKEFEKLIIGTVKFLVVKGINHKNSGTIRSPAYKMYVAIEGKHKIDKYNNGNYLKVYSDDLKSNDEFNKFNVNIQDHNEFGKYRKLLICLGSYLSPNQRKDVFNGLLCSKDTNIEIEHILPTNWKQYEKWGGHAGWTEDTHGIDINKLGNLMLLEHQYNKAASNHSFKNKKIEYAKSKFKDAIKLSEQGSDDWTPQLLENRDKEVRDRIINFVKKI